MRLASSPGRTRRLALSLLLAMGCSRHLPAVSPATAYPVTATTASGPAMYAAVHIDRLQPGALKAFIAARREWLAALSRHATTDGRGLFLQSGDSGFLSLRPLRSFGDLDRLPAASRAALASMDPADQRAYDAASDALLAPPHRSEIWRFDAALSFGADDPMAALGAAGWGKMTVEEIDPTPAGDDYEAAWKEIKDALVTAKYPLVRVAYWSSFGSGNLVTLWLAKSEAEFLQTRTVQAAVAETLGEERARVLAQRQARAVRASDSVDVIPRLDLSSKPL